jgi:hypothetical protein
MERIHRRFCLASNLALTFKDAQTIAELGERRQQRAANSGYNGIKLPGESALITFYGTWFHAYCTRRQSGAVS